MWAGKPFTVHESDAPLTVPDDVHLATEDRAEDREEFDKAVAEKIKAQEVGGAVADVDSTIAVASHRLLLSATLPPGKCPLFQAHTQSCNSLVLFHINKPLMSPNLVYLHIRLYEYLDSLPGQQTSAVNDSLLHAAIHACLPGIPQEEKRRQEELKRQREEEEAREYRKQLKFKVGGGRLGRVFRELGCVGVQWVRP